MFFRRAFYLAALSVPLLTQGGTAPFLPFSLPDEPPTATGNGPKTDPETPPSVPTPPSTDPVVTLSGSLGVPPEDIVPPLTSSSDKSSGSLPVVSTPVTPVADTSPPADKGAKTPSTHQALSTGRYQPMTTLPVCPDGSFFPMAAQTTDLTALLQTRSVGSNALDALIGKAVAKAFEDGKSLIEASLVQTKRQMEMDTAGKAKEAALELVGKYIADLKSQLQLPAPGSVAKPTKFQRLKSVFVDGPREDFMTVQIAEVERLVKSLETEYAEINIKQLIPDGQAETISRLIYYRVIIPLREVVRKAFQNREESIENLSTEINKQDQKAIMGTMLKNLHKSADKSYEKYYNKLHQAVTDSASKIAGERKKGLTADFSFTEDTVYATWLYTLQSHWHKCKRTYEILDGKFPKTPIGGKAIPSLASADASGTPIGDKGVPSLPSADTSVTPSPLTHPGERERQNFREFARKAGADLRSSGRFGAKMDSKDAFVQVEALIYVSLHYYHVRKSLSASGPSAPVTPQSEPEAADPK